MVDYRKMILKKPLFYSLLFIYFHLLFFLFSAPLFAQTMRSQNYEVHMGNINMTSGKKSSQNFSLSDTVGQSASGLYTSNGFRIGAGFWYLEEIIPFSFAISNLNLDYGLLNSNTPEVLTNVLTVSAGGAGGYQVTALENHPPQSASDNYIADVLGDNSDISEETASIWTQDTTHGFGFKMSGDDIPADFSDPACDPNCFRQFADRSASPPEEAQIIMSSSDITGESEATASYKINISGLQEAGLYQNQIIFIAVPIY